MIEAPGFPCEVTTRPQLWSAIGMSRAYRITVKESLARHLAVDDGVCSSIELLPVLPQERMGELLAAELERRGFTRDAKTAQRKEADGVVVQVDLQTGEVRATVEAHSEVRLETERSGRLQDAQEQPPASVEVRERQLRAEAREGLERQMKAEEEELRRQLTEKLERKLRDLKEEIDSVVNRVTGTALKQRAAELGQVEEIHEEADGSLTIKVRV